MPLEERRARQKSLFAMLTKNDIAHWAERFLETLTRPPRTSKWPVALDMVGAR
jgi:trehalose-6-phosphate synthase